MIEVLPAQSSAWYLTIVSVTDGKDTDLETEFVHTEPPQRLILGVQPAQVQ